MVLIHESGSNRAIVEISETANRGVPGLNHPPAD